MRMREAVLTHDGRSFVGRFRIQGQGSTASVIVQFETAVICARMGDLSEAVVVQTLLGELVRESLAGRNGTRH